MIFNMKHFPILFFILFMTSCKKKAEFSNTSPYLYSVLIDNANSKVSINQLDSAFYFFNQANLKCKKQEKEKKIYALLQMAVIQQKKSDFIGAEETTTEALSILNTTIYKSHLNTLLGIIYLGQNDYENAIFYYNKVLNTIDDELYRGILKNNVAVVYLEQQNFQKAIEILQSVIESPIVKENKIEYARILDNLGFAYFKIDNDSLAKGFLTRSLKIRDSIGNDYEKIASLVHLSQYYEMDNSYLAQEYANKALQSAKVVNSPDDKMEAIKLLINLSEPKKAKEYFNEYSKINDSITTIRQTAKNQFSKIKYDSRLAIKDAENQKNQKIIYLLLFIVSILIALFIIYIIRKKNKEREKTIGYETETRISKKLHDELANDVFNTMTFIQTQDLHNPTNKENILQSLDSIYGKARNISQQNSNVTTGKDFGKVIDEMLMSYKSDEVNVIKKGNNAINWEKLSVEKQIQIHRVLQEILVNMKKHSQATHVAIVFESLEKNIRIRYSDNGIGFDNERKTKNGLHNMENRILSIKGSITFESEINKGVKINIEFPK